MTYPNYMKYIKFACDEELERLSEFLYGIEHNVDMSGDKYYVANPHSNCPPDKDDVEKMLAGRDTLADFAIMDGSDDDAKDSLYSELRQLILYS